MKALVYHGPGQKAWEEVPEPTIQHPTDAIVRIDTTTICGTDLHMTMMVVTHEMGFAREVADRMAFFHEGRILEEGAPQQLIETPAHAETRAFLDAVL